MRQLETLVLILSSISFITVIGGAVYEHAAVVPVWTSAVPASLEMFQGEYGITPFKFWMPIHPITMLLLIGALIANWRTPRRLNIAAAIGAYALTLAVTFGLFVPELLALTGTAYSTTVDAELTRRARNWEILSLMRLVWMILTAVVLLFGLSRPAGSTD